MALSIKVNVTVPKKLMADIRFRDKIEDVMRHKTAHDVEEEFWAVTSKWQDDPELDTKIISNSSRIATEVTIYGNSMPSRIFRMVNLGTPPHPIKAKNMPYLSFQEGYVPATTPGSLISGRKRRFGKYRHPAAVKHPGMEARKFDELIAKKYKPVFEKDMQEAIDEAVRQGWG